MKFSKYNSSGKQNSYCMWRAINQARLERVCFWKTQPCLLITPLQDNAKNSLPNALRLWLYWARCRIPDSRLISFLQMPLRIGRTSVTNSVFPPAEMWILGMFTQNSGAVSSKPRLNLEYNQSCLSGLKPSHFLPSERKRFIITPSPWATTEATESPIKWLALRLKLYKPKRNKSKIGQQLDFR